MRSRVTNLRPIVHMGVACSEKGGLVNNAASSTFCVHIDSRKMVDVMPHILCDAS
uniref:Uncharacterized protein n=1 Tax=Arundo donax TaxID=35708 RepID=A0A0A8XU67_ARUDO